MSDSKNPEGVSNDRVPETDCEKRREERLDDALDDSFPASDPPAIVAPSSRKC